MPQEPQERPEEQLEERPPRDVQVLRQLVAEQRWFDPLLDDVDWDVDEEVLTEAVALQSEQLSEEVLEQRLPSPDELEEDEPLQEEPQERLEELPQLEPLVDLFQEQLEAFEREEL